MSRTLDKSQGILDKMPSVGSDPIVESGSNADGEWTRWADGTQACSNRFTLTENVDLSSSSGVFQSRSNVRLFPIAFISADYGIGSIPEGRLFVTLGPQDSVNDADRHDFRVGSIDGQKLSETLIISYTAIGRWK